MSKLVEGMVAVLRKLGLTEYEAKAYLALVRAGSADAASTAEVSGVPRTRIYDVLHSLERKNMVQQVSGLRPARYVPLPVEASLEEHKRQLIREIDLCLEGLKKLYSESFG